MSKKGLRKHLEALAIAQGKIEPVTGPKKRRNPVKSAAANNQPSAGDAVRLEGDRLFISLDGATLITNNVLLRSGDLVVSQYKRSWSQRLGVLRMQNRTLWRAWQQAAMYPVLIDVVYCVPHGAMMDRDGLTASLKYPIDALRSVELLPDDSPRYVAQALPIQLTG